MDRHTTRIACLASTKRVASNGDLNRCHLRKDGDWRSAGEANECWLWQPCDMSLLVYLLALA